VLLVEVEDNHLGEAVGNLALQVVVEVPYLAAVVVEPCLVEEVEPCLGVEVEPFLAGEVEPFPLVEAELCLALVEP
jgi:hypothetical protein